MIYKQQITLCISGKIYYESVHKRQENVSHRRIATHINAKYE